MVCDDLADISRIGTGGSPVSCSPARSFPKRRWLPREGGDPGGGELHVIDRALHDSCAFEEDENILQRASKHRRDFRNPGSSLGSTCSGTHVGENQDFAATGGTWTAANSFPSPSTLTPVLSRTADSWYGGAQKSTDERRAKRMASLQAKHAKIEAVRRKDQERIAEKVETRKQLRQDRSERLDDAVGGEDDVSFQTSMQLREFDMRATQRQCALHRAWEEKVFQPLATQAFEHMNPPSRSGLKSVEFDVPNEKFRLRVGLEADPLKSSLHEHDLEEAFHREATDVLSGSCCSSPAGSRSSAWRRQPRARSRPVLEPAEWGQNAIQATRFGRFAQIVEQGPVARLGTKGGPAAVFLPDETDGVRAAGTKTIRAGPREVLHHSVGVLHSEMSTRGESVRFRSHAGASSGAPVQDHYTYETGSRATDMEFPLGKRMYQPLF